MEGDEVFFFKQNKYPSQRRLIHNVYILSCLVPIDNWSNIEQKGT